jgi:hypothetical protein
LAKTYLRDEMKAPVPILAVLALAAPAAAQPSGAPPIQPGYWESTNRLLSPIRSEKTERRCITPADVDKFLAGPSNHHYDCAYPTRVVDNGVIQMSGICVERKGGRKVKVSGQGWYRPTSFAVSATIATRFLGIPVSGRATTEAHRIGDVCPEDAERLTMR